MNRYFVSTQILNNYNFYFRTKQHITQYVYILIFHEGVCNLKITVKYQWLLQQLSVYVCVFKKNNGYNLTNV